MINHNIDEWSILMRQQIDQGENLNEYLSKAEALIQIALNSELVIYKDSIAQNFFWTLSSLIEEAKIMNEESLRLLMKKINLPKTVAARPVKY